MIRIDIEYLGRLRCAATHGPSSVRIVTDAPVDNHGRGESFSPSDLVAGALGACMVTLMGIAAEERGWDLAGTTVRVEKHMVSEPARRIGKVEIEIHVPAALDERARAVLERAARTCPVHASLHPDVEIAARFRWGTG
ncbi:MAG: OsmC family protein [Planctomycetota bacterium]